MCINIPLRYKSFLCVWTCPFVVVIKCKHIYISSSCIFLKINIGFNIWISWKRRSHFRNCFRCTDFPFLLKIQSYCNPFYLLYLFICYVLKVWSFISKHQIYIFHKLNIHIRFQKTQNKSILWSSAYFRWFSLVDIKLVFSAHHKA